MKLKTLSCTQFAGARDQRVAFADGVNVVYGNNESGKTTLVNLLSRTLFQNARLDNRTDKAFQEQFFPAPLRSGSPAGDFADGRVGFETEKGLYTLSKEWGPDPRCALSTPEGVLRDPAAVEAALRQALGYGEGVYGQLFFSSRRGADSALRELVDAAAKGAARQELSQALSRAFSQADGLSAETIGTAISEKIGDIAGKHWDLERRQPVRKTGRWVNGLGTILRAWYALEDAREVVKDLSELEDAAAQTAAAYRKADADASEAEAAAGAFRTYAARLTVRAEREKNLSRLDEELTRLDDVLGDWPRQTSELDRARKLREEQIRLQRREKYKAARTLADRLAQMEKQRGAVPFPSTADVARAKEAQRRITDLENKLRAIDLQAAVTMLNGHAVEIRTLRTGEPLDLSGGTVPIAEAVTVTVPGVMELRLTPADLDAAAVERQLAACRASLEEVLDQFDVSCPEDLEALARTAEEDQRAADQLRQQLDLTLAGEDLETLRIGLEADNAPVRDGETVVRELAELCGRWDADRFITARETVLEGYTARYGSFEAVKVKAFDLTRERNKIQQTLSGEEDLPAQYLDLTDPEAHMEELEQSQQAARQRRETALNARIAAAERLETRRESLSGDPAQLLEDATRVFEEQQSLLDHWLHIQQVFLAQKEALDHSPAEGLADSFARYLSVLSGGGVAPEFPQRDRLDMRLYSRERLVDFSRLSEGTKGVVSLAFRLAVLDCLFPEGGVMVLDDPFADMDMERTVQACALVQECARRHQIIVLTCREEYLPLLGGHVIRI